MPQNIVYRPIKPADCAALTQLHLSTFSAKNIEATIFVSAQVAHYLAQVVAFPERQREHWLWGAWANGRLIGYAYGRALTESWHLSYLGVTPDSQANGIGRALWSRWQETGYERGYRCFTIDVERDNVRARSWYERLSYQPVDTTWFYRTELGKSHQPAPPQFQILNWENAQAWQTEYGFSQFELAADGEKWSVGRLGEKYFRAKYPLPEDVKKLLYQMEPSRQLLLLSSEPVAELEELKVSYHLKCEK